MTTPPLILALGEILWDLLPDGKQLGGAPGNFAFHAAQLGARSLTISAVGDDALGREILGRLASLHLATEFINVDPYHPTGTVTVSLDSAGHPSYAIHENTAWDFIPTTPGLLEIAAKADCVCFGTLAQRSPTSRQTIHAALARTRPDCLRILDINFRQNYFSREIVEQSLRLASVLKINDQELPVLAGLLGLAGDPIRALLAGYRLRLIAITRGGSGSALYSADGSLYEHPGHPAQPLVDTIGAGDSFTAGLAVGLLRNMPLKQINDLASRLASFVCTRPGATPALPADLLSRWSNPPPLVTLC